MIGRTLSRYEILEKLGGGGMGEVYLAEDRELRRLVALKVLPPELAASQDRLERFRREARALAALDHPNIVTVFSVEEAVPEPPAGDGAPEPGETLHFLTMQRIEGETLDRLIPSGGLDPARLQDLAIQLADALRAAHEHGIVHRDLKPANVMVDSEGRLRVLDFGLAKLRDAPATPEWSRMPTEAMTRDGVILGTYPYMSPEQVEGRSVDARSDIFSLGVMLFEMATGERPFRGDSSAALLASILTELPPAVDAVRTDLPHHLGRIVGRCLEKDLDRRYQRARDLLYELENLQRETITGAAVAPARPHGKGLRWGSRGLLAALAAVAIAAATGGLYLAGRSPDAAVAPRPAAIRSIAVLPLENLMGDPEKDYLVDGMTAALIGDLGKIGSLRVISRQSVMRYKDSALAVPEIARQLSVDAVVEGSVLVSENRVRVATHLIATDPERQLWSKAYDRDLEDVLRLYSEVARTIAEEIQVALTPQEASLLASARRVDPRAYDIFLRGREQLESGRPDGAERARRLFEQARARDPDSALALLGLANYWIFSNTMGFVAADEAYPKAKEAAYRLLAIDDDLAEAHLVLADCIAYWDWDWQGAEREFRRALELNPNLQDTRTEYAHFLTAMGRTEESAIEWDRALELGPLDPFVEALRAMSLMVAGRTARAEETFHRALEIDPDQPIAHWGLWLLHHERGRPADALEAARRFLLAIGHGEAAGGLAEQESEDYRRAMRAAAEALAERSARSHVLPWFVAELFAHAEEDDLALEWLGRAYEERNAHMVFLAVWPSFDGLRGLAVFQDLLERMDLVEAAERLAQSRARAVVSRSLEIGVEGGELATSIEAPEPVAAAE